MESTFSTNSVEYSIPTFLWNLTLVDEFTRYVKSISQIQWKSVFHGICCKLLSSGIQSSKSRWIHSILWKTELYCFVENVHSINSMEISFPFVVNIIPVESSLLKLDEFTLWRSSVLPPPLFCTMHFHKEIILEKFSVSTTESPIIKRFSGCWQIKLKLHFNHSRKNF